MYLFNFLSGRCPDHGPPSFLLWSIFLSFSRFLCQLNDNIASLQKSIQSFEQTKSDIVSSPLGQALKLTAASTWAQIVEKIKSIVNRGDWNGSISSSGGSVTVPAGIHSGAGKVTGPTLAGLIGNNVTLASAANLLSGVTAYGKNGTKYTGTMATPVNHMWSRVYKEIINAGSSNGTAGNGGITFNVSIPANSTVFLFAFLNRVSSKLDMSDLHVKSNNSALTISQIAARNVWTMQYNYCETRIYKAKNTSATAQTLTFTRGTKDWYDTGVWMGMLY